MMMVMMVTEMKARMLVVVMMGTLGMRWEYTNFHGTPEYLRATHLFIPRGNYCDVLWGFWRKPENLEGGKSRRRCTGSE